MCNFGDAHRVAHFANTKKIIAFAKTNYLYLCTISNYTDHQFPQPTREKKATKKG